jgi:hypothetical protein
VWRVSRFCTPLILSLSKDEPFCCTPLILSLSKDEPFCSWFDTLTTSEV